MEGRTGHKIIRNYINAAVDRLSDSGVMGSESSVTKLAEQLINDDIARAALTKQAALADQTGRSLATTLISNVVKEAGVERRVFKALRSFAKSKGVKDLNKLKRSERVALIKDLKTSNKTFGYKTKDMETWVGRQMSGKRRGKRIANTASNRAYREEQLVAQKAIIGKSEKSIAALKRNAAKGKGGKDNPFVRLEQAKQKAARGRIAILSKDKALKKSVSSSGETKYLSKRKPNRQHSWTTKKQIKKNIKNQAEISQTIAGQRSYNKVQKTKDLSGKGKKDKLKDNETWGKFKDWISRTDVQTGAAAGVGTALVGSALLGD